VTRSWDQLQREAASAGFPADSLEKVFKLLALLGGVSRDPYLRPRVALKGGTAINLFELELPRLSVDIDLNYIGAVEREAMLAERPRVEASIEAVCRRLDLVVKRVPTDHADGKWRLGQPAPAGRSPRGRNERVSITSPFDTRTARFRCAGPRHYRRATQPTHATCPTSAAPACSRPRHQGPA
jgi:hypothetical protein